MIIDVVKVVKITAELGVQCKRIGYGYFEHRLNI